MLVLSSLHKLLSQVISLPDLHTAVLLTTTGQLVSAAYDQARPKDEIRVVVGLSGEVWQETKEQGYGMVDSEMGRILVLPVDQVRADIDLTKEEGPKREPLMLIALNSTSAVHWDELQAKGRILAQHLQQPLNKYRELLSPPSTPGTTSPDRPHPRPTR